MKIPSIAELLEYAIEGIQTRIGLHPEPTKYPREIQELKDHLQYAHHFKNIVEALDKEYAHGQR